jgi:futalosine hydrolase
MLLVTAATDFEMEPFLRACTPATACTSLVTGVGPVETAVRLTAFLASTSLPVAGVVNFGVAGAYILDDRDNAAVLDICLAEREVLADLGICSGEEVKRLQGEGLEILDTFDLDAALLSQAESLLATAAIPFKRGVFATVSCVSGTRSRGGMLARRHRVLCENMEGAAAARACLHFGVPLLELRCVSNLVEDRNLQNWQLHKACVRCGEVAALIVKGLLHGLKKSIDPRFFPLSQRYLHLQCPGPQECGDGAVPLGQRALGGCGDAQRVGLAGAPGHHQAVFPRLRSCAGTL